MSEPIAITDDLLDKCHPFIDFANNTLFYHVESRTEDGKTYTVRFDVTHKALTCTCPAGNPPNGPDGLPLYPPRTCWHIRAAVEHARLLAFERKEQREIEFLVRQGLDRVTASHIVYDRSISTDRSRLC